MNFWSNYYKFFGIQEIENSKTLQYLYYALWMSILFSFNVFSSKNFTTETFSNLNFTACPPYFLNCRSFLGNFNILGHYSFNIFFIFILITLFAGANYARQAKWSQAHLSFLMVVFFKLLILYVFTYGIFGNYDYYDTALALIWLLASEKLYFSKLGFVWFYFLASTIKFDDGWIFANYFRSLVYGAPFIPDQLVIVATNIVILSQVLGSFFLLSNNKKIQRLAFYFFFFFHVYSGVMVLYRYLMISIPAEFILFNEFVTFNLKKISRKTFFGYSFLLFLLLLQLLPIYIGRDYKKTMQGIYYGLYMFHASDQCINKVTENYSDGTSKSYAFDMHNVPTRCDAYYVWYYLRERCQTNSKISKISWQYYSSINGHPYDRQVDTDDACALNYSSFSRNNWIRTQNVSTNIPIYKTGYLDPLDPSIKIPTDPIISDDFLLAAKIFYWSLWVLVILYLGIRLLRVTYNKTEDKSLIK